MIFEIIFILIVLIIILLYHGINIVGNFNKHSNDITINFKILIFEKIIIYSINYPSEKNKKDKNENNKRKIDLELLGFCIGPLLKFFKKFLKCLKVKKLQTHVDLGLSSYVSTAKYVGYLWSIFVIPNTTLENTSFSATPHFNGRVFDLKGQVDIKINILKLIIPTLKLLSNKNIKKFIKSVRK